MKKKKKKNIMEKGEIALKMSNVTCYYIVFYAICILKSQHRTTVKMFVYKIQVNPMAIKRILKINNSWPESFNFQNSFNCH